MSQENVEIVRRGFAARNRGDFDGALEYMAPDAGGPPLPPIHDRLCDMEVPPGRR